MLSNAAHTNNELDSKALISQVATPLTVLPVALPRRARVKKWRVRDTEAPR